MKVVEFAFYLEAWKYCKDNGIELNKIQKKDFRTWLISS